MTQPVIQAERLQFAYGDHAVLGDISFTVAAGEIYGLVGADGAGKTTLLRMAVGQLKPATGVFQVLGQPADGPALRAQVAYMPQGFGLYRDLSVQENLDFFADLHGLTRTQARERIGDLLQRTGLHGFEDRRANNLSGGMMQKLALACALVSEPRVMVLDEPTTGVDPVSRRAFWRLLDGVRAEGVTILYATANLDEAERCDRVGLLEQGRLRRQGPPLALAAVDGGAMAVVSGPKARHYRPALQELPGVELVFPVGRQLRVWLTAGSSLADFRAQLAECCPGLTAAAITPSLSDAALRELALGALGSADV